MGRQVQRSAESTNDGVSAMPLLVWRTQHLMYLNASNEHILEARPAAVEVCCASKQYHRRQREQAHTATHSHEHGGHNQPRGMDWVHTSSVGVTIKTVYTSHHAAATA